MTILLTGASGFVGRSYLQTLSPISEPVLAVDVMEPIQRVHHKLPVEYLPVDLLNQDAVAKLILEYRPTTIIHLAAISKVSDKEALHINVSLTKNILSAIVNIDEKIDKPKVLLAGSAAEYGDIRSDELPPDETSKLCPIEPYAESKAICSKLAYTYRRDFDIPITILRFANIYGPGQETGKLIPNLVRNAHLGDSLRLNSHGYPTRQWVYIDDACKAIDLAIKHIQTNKGTTFNIGHPQEISLRTLATIVNMQMQSQALARGMMPNISILDFQPSGGGAYRVAMDVALAQKSLGWKAQIDIQEGIKRIVFSYLEGVHENSSDKDSRRADLRAVDLQRPSRQVRGNTPNERSS